MLSVLPLPFGGCSYPSGLTGEVKNLTTPARTHVPARTDDHAQTADERTTPRRLLSALTWTERRALSAAGNGRAGSSCGNTADVGDTHHAMVMPPSADTFVREQYGACGSTSPELE